MRRHQFTLLETTIAAVILAMAVASTMGIVSGARGTLLKAETRWAREHLLAQATEFYLLGGPAAPVPLELLPEGFSATCQIAAVEDLEEAALEPHDGWILCEYTITLFDPDGNNIGSNQIRKVLKQEDIP